MLILPTSWTDIQPDIIYQTSKGNFISFSQTQIELGKFRRAFADLPQEV